VTGHVEIPVVQACGLARDGYRWGLPTSYVARCIPTVADPKKLALAAGESILPATKELVIETPGGIPPTGNASLVVTMAVQGKIFSNQSFDNIPFDVNRNSFYCAGKLFEIIRTTLDTDIGTLLGLGVPAEPVVVSGKLIVGNAVLPIANQLTVSLTLTPPRP
jgi:hypothetical protein